LGWFGKGSRDWFDLDKAQRKRAADGCGDLPPAKIPPLVICAALYNMLHLSEKNEKEPVRNAVLALDPGNEIYTSGCTN